MADLGLRMLGKNPEGIAQGVNVDVNGNLILSRNIEEIVLENRTLEAGGRLSTNVTVRGRGLWIGYRLEDETDIKVAAYPRGAGTTMGGPDSTAVTFIDREGSEGGGGLVPEEFLPAEVRIDVNNVGDVDTSLRTLVAVHKL